MSFGSNKRQPGPFRRNGPFGLALLFWLRLNFFLRKDLSCSEKALFGPRNVIFKLKRTLFGSEKTIIGLWHGSLERYKILIYSFLFFFAFFEKYGPNRYA